MGKSEKLRRVQELFECGDIVVIGGVEGAEPEVFWVMKPNAFQHDEAMKDGRFGRALRMKTFDYDPNESEAVDAVIVGTSEEELIETLAASRGAELLQRAHDEVRADPEWQERYDIIERAALAEDRPLSDAESEALAKVLQDHNVAVQGVYVRLLTEQREEYSQLTRAELEKAFRAHWREMVGANAFFENRRQTEIFYALRDCEAELVDGEWRHDACKRDGAHRRQVLSSRDEVLTELPEELLQKVGEVLDRQMTPAQAGNSGAPTASSRS